MRVLVVQAWAGGRFRISGALHEGALFVLPGQTIPWPFTGTVSDLAESDFDLLAARSAEIDVVLLGCGAAMQFLPLPLRNALKARGLSVDVMDTGAACRTYNVLLAEGRRVAAALLPSS